MQQTIARLTKARQEAEAEMRPIVEVERAQEVLRRTVETEQAEQAAEWAKEHVGWEARVVHANALHAQIALRRRDPRYQGPWRPLAKEPVPGAQSAGTPFRDASGRFLVRGHLAVPLAGVSLTMRKEVIAPQSADSTPQEPVPGLYDAPNRRLLEME